MFVVGELSVHGYILVILEIDGHIVYDMMVIVSLFLKLN